MRRSVGLPALAGAILYLGLGAPPAAAQTPAPRPCAASEFGQFDFWVGHWDVRVTGRDKVVAHSLIEKLYDGCAIRENWAPLQGGAGGSLSGYDALKRAWRQTWTDASGGWAEFEGGWNGAAMVLTGTWPDAQHPDRRVRMTYTPAEDGSVRQFGEQSDDGGKTWTASFDFTYRKAPA